METVNIYQIGSPLTPLVYIGSTCKKINKRLQQHKSSYKQYLEGTYGYCRSFDIFELDQDCKIKLIEVCDADVRAERERWWIDNTENTTNKCLPGRTHNESVSNYKKNNKNKIYEYRLEYCKNNKDKINEKFDCKCGINYTYSNKARHEKTQKHLIFLCTAVVVA